MGLIDEEILDSRKITSEDLCYCGSGNIYRECCKKKDHDSWLSKEEIENIEKVVFYSGKAPKSHLKTMLGINEKCFIAICKKKAIWSHTISASWMRSVFKESSVAMPSLDWENYLLKEVPISKASIFMGWCEEHDYDLFQEIDQGFDINNSYHLNLMTYRSISKEFRIKENHLRQIYSFLCLSDSCNKDLCLSILLGEYLWVRDNYKLMTFVYNGIQTETRKGLKHRVFNLWKISPIFVSSAITPNRKPNKKRYEVLSLNLYTDKDSNGYFIISYPSWYVDSEKLYKKLKKEEKKETLIPCLNELISKNCDNIVCDKSRAEEKLVDDRNNPPLFFPYDTPTFDYIKPLSAIGKS